MLVWGNNNFVFFLQTPLEQSSDKSILDAGFEPGKKNFLHLTDKDGEQPHIMSVSKNLSIQNKIGCLPQQCLKMSASCAWCLGRCKIYSYVLSQSRLVACNFPCNSV